jgi:hypothetical protein
MRKKTTPKKKVIPKKTSSKKTSYKKTSSKKITPKKKVTTQRRKEETVLTKIKNVFDDIKTLLPGESAVKEPDQYKSKIK